MDQGLKERLIGAAVLVALGVWLIPWLLDGSDDADPASEPDLELPVPGGGSAAQVRTEVIDLQAPHPPIPAGAAAAPSVSHEAAATLAARKASEVGGVPQAADAASAGRGPSSAGRGPSPAGEPASASAEPRAADAAPTRASSASSSRSESSGADESTAARSDAASAIAAKPASNGGSHPERSSAAPRAEGDWAIQLGSFGEQDNAHRLAARVAGYGDKPQISTFKADGRVMYRVRLGPYETRARAEAAASALSVHGFVAQVVTAD